MGKYTASALRFDDSLPAPIVTAHGRGELAHRMVDLARKSGVPVKRAPELAERLIVLQPESVIPEELYGPVATIFAFLMEFGDPGERTNKEE